MAKSFCAHCGLPVITSKPANSGAIYCCYGCYLVSRIVGNQPEGTAHAWSLLRLGIGAFFAMDVMMISLLLYTGQAESSAVEIFRWTLLGLAVPAMAILGYPFALGTLADLRRGRFSFDSLIAVGAFTAFGVSAANTISGTGHIYFDTATMLPVLVTFGKLVEATAKTRTGHLVRGLESLLPVKALRIKSEATEEIDVAAIRPGDRLRVRSGDRFAADGVILEGTTTVEESSFTGESQPRVCGPGDAVLAGTVNGEGSLVIEARQVGESLLLSRIIDMVEESWRRGSPSARIAEKLAAWFFPAVFLLALSSGAVWLVLGGWAKAGSVILAILVVACPCAMGIATPLATSLAIARAARRGILVRGGDILERVGQVDAIFLDKTGTLTVGKPILQRIELTDPTIDDDELLAWAASVEVASEHPLARVIVHLAESRELALSDVRDVRVAPGRGICGRASRDSRTRDVRVGTVEFVVTGGRCAALPESSATSVAVAWDGELRGHLFFEDVVRKDAQAAVRQLHQMGIQTILLSGDRAESTRTVAANVGIEHIHAPCRPDEKIDVLHAAIDAGSIVAMAGDGINDAPALAAASVGIALGAGTDLARQAGHVVLLSNRLADIPWLIALSCRTRRVIVQNLFWAFGYNAIALAVAAMGLLHPLLAALAMVVSSLTVIANSVRLQSFQVPDGGSSKDEVTPEPQTKDFGAASPLTSYQSSIT